MQEKTGQTFIKQITDLAGSLILETIQLLRFYSRLPMPVLSFEKTPYAAPDFSTSIRSLPFAAIILAMPSFCMIAFGTAIALPATIIAVLAVAVSALATGAFHEDGLADTADSIGGGASVQRRLEIMRDSRIGTYGAVALMLVLMLKIFSIAALINQNGWLVAAFSFMAAGMVSRVAGILPHMIMPPARAEGRSVSVGKPQPFAAFTAILITLLFSFISLNSFGNLKIIVGLVLVTVFSSVLCIWAQRKLGGHTGDILGAIQQVGDVAFLIILTASFG